MLRNNQSRTKTAIIFMYLIIAISAVVALYEISLITSGITIEEADFENNLTTVISGGFLGILLIGIAIGNIITFILWFRRAYYNLHQISDSLTYTEGWAAGAWFVPIINLIRPYKIMNELYDEAAILLDEEDIPEKSLIGWWWGLFLIRNFFDNFSNRVSTSLEESTLIGITLIGLAITVAAAFVTIKVIQGYSKLEERLYVYNHNDSIEEIGSDLT